MEIYLKYLDADKMRVKSIWNIWTRIKWEVKFQNTNFPSQWALTNSALIVSQKAPMQEKTNRSSIPRKTGSYMKSSALQKFINGSMSPRIKCIIHYVYECQWKKSCCLWQLSLMTVFEDCHWLLSLTTFYACIWRMFFTTVFDDFIIWLPLTTPFEDCLWRMTLATGFDNWLLWLTLTTDF